MTLPRLKDFLHPPVLDQVLVTEDGNAFELLREGKWVSGRFDGNIRLDHATHGAGQTHAHVMGRKGNEIGVVNVDGTASHGTRCKLSDEDADALRARGFKIRDDNIVEWVLIDGEQPMLLPE
jgi:hypothetical protein